MRNKQWKQYGAMITAAVFLTVAGISYGFARKEPDSTIELRGPEVSLEMRDDVADLVVGSDAKTMSEETVPVTIYVHICGEVAKPGVYQLTEGSRIVDAVTAAGGFTEYAAEEAVNLAEIVTDGMQIVIPDREEADAAAKELAEKMAGLVDLNTATKEQLMELPGIGASKAEDIVRYREESGGFHSIEEIMNVPGIKEAGFQKIKDRIGV